MLGFFFAIEYESIYFLLMVMCWMWYVFCFIYLFHVIVSYFGYGVGFCLILLPGFLQ